MGHLGCRTVEEKQRIRRSGRHPYAAAAARPRRFSPRRCFFTERGAIVRRPRNPDETMILAVTAADWQRVPRRKDVAGRVSGYGAAAVDAVAVLCQIALRLEGGFLRVGS